MHLGMYDSSEEGAIAYFRHWEVTHPDELRRALVRQKQQKEKAAQQQAQQHEIVSAVHPPVARKKRQARAMLDDSTVTPNAASAPACAGLPSSFAVPHSLEREGGVGLKGLQGGVQPGGSAKPDTTVAEAELVMSMLLGNGGEN
jgi:hypothetical protein